MDVSFLENNSSLNVTFNGGRDTIDAGFSENIEVVEPRNHNDLLNRNVSDCHPESSITNLQADLNARPSTVITDEEIMAL